MEGSCARAVEIGLPSIAFTEHIDLVRWLIPPENRASMERGESGPVPARMAPHIAPDHRFAPPPLDVDGYLASIERCRARFPGLRIVTGIELGEPHWFAEQSQQLLATGAFERVLGSLHTITIDGSPRDVFGLLASGESGGPGNAGRPHPAEINPMIEKSHHL